MAATDIHNNGRAVGAVFSVRFVSRYILVVGLKGLDAKTN
jgi:hypothetical protein